MYAWSEKVLVNIDIIVCWGFAGVAVAGIVAL
jgi:hypothetical protein